jgi:hypothetical protein
LFVGTSIGKKYARADEIGVPLAVTVDSTSMVTIRERDSKTQIRVKITKVPSIVKRFVEGKSTWVDMQCKMPNLYYFILRSLSNGWRSFLRLLRNGWRLFWRSFLLFLVCFVYIFVINSDHIYDPKITKTDG